eukprot:scaffold1386_cov119-Isochrysis_galbana.AAC.4
MVLRYVQRRARRARANLSGRLAARCNALLLWTAPRCSPLWFPHGTGRNKFGGAKRRRTITSTPSTPDDDIFAEESDQEELDG